VFQDDEWLAVRCQLGESAAFDELVERWHAPLWHYARRLTNDDEAAADVVQEVWVRVVRGLPRLRDGARLRAWIFGIARRVLMDRLRERYATPRMQPLDDHEPAADDPGTIDEDVALMQEELAALPVPDRELLVLFYLREFTLGQLAEVLAVPVGTVKSRLFRARRMLRERLATKGLT
jgi:RNA polymerase sigma-70 factor (ECF subfamily)